MVNNKEDFKNKFPELNIFKIETNHFRAHLLSTFDTSISLDVATSMYCQNKSRNHIVSIDRIGYEEFGWHFIAAYGIGLSETRKVYRLKNTKDFDELYSDYLITKLANI